MRTSQSIDSPALKLVRRDLIRRRYIVKGQTMREAARDAYSVFGDEG